MIQPKPDRALIVDCTKELNPQVPCYTLYKGAQKQGKIWRSAGIHTILFKTEICLGIRFLD